MKLISVIVPAYKQENNITVDLKRIYSELLLLPYDFELICVVDGHADRTYQRAQQFARGKQIKVLQYAINQGKGFAIRYGMKHSRGDVVGFVDAGGDINVRGIRLLLDYMYLFEADIVIASKRHIQSLVQYPWQRRILSWGYQFLVRTLFGLNVGDTQVGMKFYKRWIVKQVLPLASVRGFAFDVEVLAIAKYLGQAVIYESPVDLALDFGGKSVITGPRLFKTILVMLADTLEIFYRLRFQHMTLKKNTPKKQIVEQKLGIPGDYQLKAINSGNFLQAHWHQNKLQAISHLLTLNKQSQVLDVGAGSGNFEFQFAKRVKSITSIDYNDQALRFLKAELKRRKISNVKTKLLDIKNLHQLKANSFTDIVMIDVIEHLPMKVIHHMVQDFAKILKPGGKACIITPNYQSFWPAIEYISDTFHLLPQFSGEQHISKFSKLTLRNLFLDKDWQVETETSFNLFSYFWPTKKGASQLTELELKLSFLPGNLIALVVQKKDKKAQTVRLKKWQKAYAQDQTQLYRNPIVRSLFDLGHHYLARHTPNKGTVLDIGAGIGYHLKFQKNLDKLRYICLDRDAQMLAQIKNSNVQTIHAGAEKIPLRNKTIDTILASHILEHIPELEDCLKECRRVLKKDGQLLVVLPTDPGLLWNISTQFSPSRKRLQQLGLSYTEVMAHEHVNHFTDCETLIKKYFQVKDRTFYPSTLPSHHLNLLACYTLIPR